MRNISNRANTVFSACCEMFDHAMVDASQHIRRRMGLYETYKHRVTRSWKLMRVGPSKLWSREWL